jgi:hypothetical protein
MKKTEDTYVDIIAEEGMELWNGEVATNRVSAPIGTDLSMWLERPITLTKNTEEDAIEQENN